MGHKATAQAHPIQGLIKYHGLKDFRRRIPFHDSISVCTEPTVTTTTIEVLDEGRDSVTIDGAHGEGRELERALDVLNEVRRRADSEQPFKMVSASNFASGVGLGASSSGFAALALAAASAWNLKLEPRELTEIARLGAGSASRSVAGGFAEWHTEPETERSWSRCIATAKEIDMRIVVALVPQKKQTDDSHKAVLSSPLFAARLEYVPAMLEKMRKAVAARDIAAIAQLAEQDTENLHKVTAASPNAKPLWTDATRAVIAEVKRMRETERIRCWYSIDTGATVYVNTYPEHEAYVASRLRDVKGVEDALFCKVGGPARLVEEHLF